MVYSLCPEAWGVLTPAVKRALGTPPQVTHNQDVPLSGREQAVPVAKLCCVSTSNPLSKVSFVLRGWSHSWSKESRGWLCSGGGVTPRGTFIQSHVVVVETELRTPSLTIILERSLPTNSVWLLLSSGLFLIFLLVPTRTSRGGNLSVAPL